MILTSFPKEKLQILLLENVSPEAERIFKSNGYTDVSIINKSLSEEEIIAKAKEVHVIGIRSKTQLTKEILKAAEKLLCIGTYCIGTDQVNLETATEQGIPVFNAPFSNTRSVAEMAIGAFILLIRRLLEKNNNTHAGIWNKDATNCYELRGKTLGIIGYGNIGSQVSVLAEGLGMRIRFYDIEKKLPLGNAQAAESMEALLEASDIVTLHVPATPQTENMINENSLRHFKKGALLVNYSRGKVVDLNALKTALEEQKLHGAALDVYPAEPAKNGMPFECTLQNMPNVLLTPHIGGSTEEAQQNIGFDVTSKLLSFIETGNTSGSLTIPNIALPLLQDAHRILHIHENMPGVLSEINTKLAGLGINILSQYLSTNPKVGYVVLDVEKKLSGDALQLMKEVKGTIKTRILF